MANFCGKCGSRLDKATGLCPRCDANELNKHIQAPTPKQDTISESAKPLSKKEAKKKRKADKKAAKKVKKKEKWAAMATGQKARRFFLKLIAVLFLLALLVSGIAGALIYLGIVDTPVISSIFEEKTSSNIFENGDYVATPGLDHIDYDAETNMLYFNNQLIVYTFTDLKREEADLLAELIGGKIVGDISGSINALQIQVDSSTLDELKAMADKLMESENVLYAGYDYPIQPSPTTADSNPWSADGNTPELNRSNESAPSGNDWWAEAIGAYTAWDYSNQCQQIKVGILDSGFDVDHEDLNGSITFLPDYTTNSEANHGTHVAGIIGANNNTVGIRGIADSAEMVCLDWSPLDSTNYLSTGDYIEIIKQMIDADVKIINNSWGNYFLSEAGYMLDLYWDEEGNFEEINNNYIQLSSGENDSIEYRFIGNSKNNVQFYINQNKVTYENFVKNVQPGCFIRLVTENSKVKEVYYIEDGYGYLREQLAVKFTGAYDSYVNYCEAVSSRTGLECILMIVQLILNQNDEFLIVQASGNGYDNGGAGVDTIYSGFFCAINSETYNILSISTRAALAQKGIDYNTIKEHILIVGAVENKYDTKGYRMTNFSNFGENVDICAPGQDIYSTLTNSDYGQLSGTSMAAPMVSGSAALIWSLNPELSAQEVRNILLTNITTHAYGVDDGSTYTYPMLNVGAAAKTVSANMVNGHYGQSNIPSGAVKCNGHYYYVYELDTLTTWEEAKQYCESQGGYLATITSQEENEFVYSYLRSNFDYESAYFGFTDRNEEGTWIWANGEKSSYTNWHPGEPNSENPNEDYAMYYFKYSDGTWNDGDFGNRTVNSGRVFICEWGEYNDQHSTTSPEDENTALGKYLAAVSKTTESGSWTEQLTLEADLFVTNGSSKTKTKMTLNSTSDVSNYIEGNLSNIQVSSISDMTIMGQTYAWSTEYQDGVAHYQYTEPVQSSQDLEIDPNFFDFDVITQEAIIDEETSGNQIRFTISGDSMAAAGIAAVEQINGVDNLKYGDVEVTVTLSNLDTVETIVMVFDASMEYQGFNSDVSYHIQYRFV